MSDATEFKENLKRANEGGVDAQCQVAYAYFEGKGVKKDLKKSLQWFQKAAKAGSGWGNHMAGAMHETGKGTSKNAKKAMVYYKAAADTGNTSAAFNLAVLYETGAKPSLAKDYYEKAASLGHAKAALNRAGMAMRETPVDVKHALQYLAQSHDLGEASAKNQLVTILENLGVMKVLKK